MASHGNANAAPDTHDKYRAELVMEQRLPTGSSVSAQSSAAEDLSAPPQSSITAGPIVAEIIPIVAEQAVYMYQGLAVRLERLSNEPLLAHDAYTLLVDACGIYVNESPEDLDKMRAICTGVLRQYGLALGIGSPEEFARIMQSSEVFPGVVRLDFGKHTFEEDSSSGEFIGEFIGWGLTGVEGWEVVFSPERFLHKFPNVSQLDLSHARIGNEGATVVSQLVQLVRLNLVDNGIGAEGATALSVLDKLQVLNLGCNRIGAEGAAALSTLDKLRVLNLRSNEIRAEGAAALSALDKLQVLNLSDNWISAQGAAALSALDKLQVLNLTDNFIGDEGVAALSSLDKLQVLGLRRVYELYCKRQVPGDFVCC